MCMTVSLNYAEKSRIMCGENHLWVARELLVEYV